MIAPAPVQAWRTSARGPAERPLLPRSAHCVTNAGGAQPPVQSQLRLVAVQGRRPHAQHRARWAVDQGLGTQVEDGMQAACTQPATWPRSTRS